MSKADDLFIAMCKDIIENGYSTEGEKVRPKWEIDTYTITFKNYDGTILQSGSVAYGATPEYIGETPTKAEDDVAYEFKDWDSEIMPVTKDATYNAKFYKKLMQKWLTLI